MYIRKFDFITPLITLYYKGEDKHSSLFSGFFSIILSIIVSIICIFISFDFLFKQNPTAFYYKIKVKDTGIFKLAHNNFFHYLTFIDEKTKENAFDEKLFSVIGLNNGKISDFLNGNNISEYNFSHWKYEKCEKINLENANIANIYITEKYFNFSLCITKYYDKENNKIISYEDQNFPYPKLENNLEKEYATNYEIILKLCENFTEYNNNSCYDSEIIHLLPFEKEIKYYLNFYENNINIDDYKIPVTKQLNNISFNYDPTFIETNKINLLQTYVRTSDGIIFNDKTIIKTYNIDSFYNDFMYNHFNSFAKIIEIKMLNKIEIYHREYKKLQDIAGSVDGIIEFIILVVQILNNFFYHNYRLINDFNNVIEEKVDKIKNLNKIESHNLSLSKDINTKILCNNFMSVNRQRSKFSCLPKVTVERTSTFNLKNLNYQNEATINKLNLNNSSFNKINLNKMNESFGKTIFNNHENKIVSNFQKFSWCLYMKSQFNFLKKKKYYYSIKVLALRKRILSEERLLKNYWKIKKLNEGLFDFKIKSENISLSSLPIDNKKS